MRKDIDFDVLEFCKKLKESKQPPYRCPVAECGRSYRSIIGLQYHLGNYDHKNPTPVVTSSPMRHSRGSRRKGRARSSHHKVAAAVSAPPPELLQPVVREALTYAEAQKMVEFEVDGRIIRVGINDSIAVMSKEDYEAKHGANVHPQVKEGKNVQRLEPFRQDEQSVQLPEPKFTILEDYNIPDAPSRPNAYIRFIERSADELDGEVEYDLDEEDCAWLAIINEARNETGLPAVSIDTFELLMDRLEKESYLQMANNRNMECTLADDDAICCICMDGECQNTNVILFCDMCNLAVHQDCYGVPYIPEGQWICRRCLQSPTKGVDCVLCPNTGGAFKQTDRGHWAHVVCALWIPEVRFANTVFLEPIDSIETIPPARWKLTCYICKQKGVGACIQCHKTNCYAAFHVTCAQHAGLYMKMDTVPNTLGEASGGGGVMVQKTAYCDAHTPADAEPRPRLPQNPTNVQSPEGSPTKIKKGRRGGQKNRASVPAISIPTIPSDRIQEIGALVQIPKKSQFIQRLIGYWTLKRQFRNGVPLLRRLQSTHLSRRDDSKLHTELGEFYRQIKYLQCLRQDLEKARLLCELVRKREKKKNELTRAKEACLMVELCPIRYFLKRIWDQISAKDTQAIFMEPVDTTEVPDYTDVVKHPMDLSTMRAKIEEFSYKSFSDFEDDFNLMINNCLAYNAKDTIFYKAALRMREQGGAIIKYGIENALEAGFDEATGLILSPETKKNQENMTVQQIDAGLNELSKKSHTMSLNDQMKKLMEVADLAQSLKNPTIRNKKCRIIKMEMTNLKRKISKATPSPKKEKPESSKLKMSARVELEKIEKDASKKTSKKEEESDGDTSSSEDRPLKPPSQQSSKQKKTTNEEASKDGPQKREKASEKGEVLTTPKKSTPVSNNSATVSPTSSGINRRTAVLFTRKAQAAFRKSTPPVELTTASATSSKKRPGRPRRNGDPSFKSSQSNSGNSLPASDSFRIYRSSGEMHAETDEESQSDSSCSSCTSATGSSCSSETSDVDRALGEDDEEDEDDEDEDEEDEEEAESSSSHGGDEDEDGEASEKSEAKPVFEPLDIVWAKCRGYPWYPALIINPKMPRNYVHNGVPIPAPPADVLALANSYSEPVYLVLFFDAKRTWQWLPRNKLEVLGLKPELDKAKLNESRKPTERKAVRKAYQDALKYKSQVDQKKEDTEAT